MGESESEQAPELVTSVLIVAYNCEPALRRCLESLEASRERESFEILVVDCGSRDGSREIDADFPGVTGLRLPRNFGLTKARNIGARTAKGEFLLFLKPDVTVAPDTVAALSGWLRNDDGLVAVAPLLVDEAGAAISRTGPLPDPAALIAAWAADRDWADATLERIAAPSEPVAVECPDPAALLVRAKAVRGMSYFDERYGEFGSDLEFDTQAYKASKKILLVPGVTATRRPGEGIWKPSADDEKTALRADYAAGIVTYAGKHYGLLAGLKVRLRLWLKALVSFQIGLFIQVLSGQRIDGSQTAV